jgi:hypothetical protein
MPQGNFRREEPIYGRNAKTNTQHLSGILIDTTLGLGLPSVNTLGDAQGPTALLSAAACALRMGGGGNPRWPQN